MEQKRTFYIYGLLFVVTAIWGLNLVILKVLVAELPPQTMTAFRIMIAGLVALFVILLGRSYRKMTGREWVYTLLGMVFGVTLHHSLMAYGLTMIDASNASLILALVPITTALLGVIFLGEKLTRARLAGFALALAGVFFIQSNSLESTFISKGEVILFLAMLAQALSFIFVRKTTRTVDSKQVTTIMYLAGSVSLLIVSFINEPDGIAEMYPASPFTYFLFIFSGVVATGVGYIVFNAGIQGIGASQSAIFNNFVPFFGVIFSVIFLNENIFVTQIIGFILIVTGILFGTGYIEKRLMDRRKRI